MAIVIQVAFAAPASAAGSISGSLTGPNGAVGGACATLIAPGGGAGGQVVFTAADGSFSFSNVAAGDYRVSFQSRDNCPFPGPTSPPFVTEFWEDEYLARNADVISVATDQNVTGIDAIVAPTKPTRISISGTVTDDTGLRAGVCVTASGPEGPTGQIAVTGADGTYAITDVEDGTYSVAFFTGGCPLAAGPDIVSEFYSDKPVPGPGDPVVVPDTGGISGIDALVNVPPDTSITSGPAGTSGPDVSLSFASNDPAATFQCSLDHAAYEACASPKTYSALPAGGHTVSVRAVDAPGDPDQSPAAIAWTVGSGGGQSTQGTVPPGGTVTTDATGEGATSSHPVTTAVAVPAGGQVTIREDSKPSADPPNGFSLLGYEIEVTAPAATVDDPLRITFVLDRTVLDGADPDSVTVLRDGDRAGNCADSRAVPDPCVAGRRNLEGGDLALTVLAAHASKWNFAEAVCAVPKLIGLKLGKAKKKLKQAGCKLGKVKKKASAKKKGTVIAQKPKPKTEKPAGAKVAVTVSKG